LLFIGNIFTMDISQICIYNSACARSIILIVPMRDVTKGPIV
jgi:hypothetical protein